METKFYEKLLPVQDKFTNLYQKQIDNIYKDIYELILNITKTDIKYGAIKLTATEMFSQEEMGSNPVNMSFLQTLLKISNAKRVLEIGTFIGFSAMFFADALPADGEVVTIEKFDKFAEMAKKNFQDNNKTNIRLIVGDAFDIISKDDLGTFDIIFIDGNKEKYDIYFEMCSKMLSSKGIIIVDDVFFHGDALNSPQTTEKGAGVRRMLENVKNDSNFSISILPIGNGLAIITKNAE